MRLKKYGAKNNNYKNSHNSYKKSNTHIGPPGFLGGPVKDEGKYVVALAGNPNVGKSTVFNALTGMRQHTGNWPGKTVELASGGFSFSGSDFTLIDLPGVYSLMAHSVEEEVARDYICFGGADAIIVVCDATCLERNLNLVLQTLEITNNVIVLVNLMDEARKKGIAVDKEALKKQLGVKVVCSSARNDEGLDELRAAVYGMCETAQKTAPDIFDPHMLPPVTKYDEPVEYAINIIEDRISGLLSKSTASLSHSIPPSRFFALKLLEGDTELANGLHAKYGVDLLSDDSLLRLLDSAKAHLLLAGFNNSVLEDCIVTRVYEEAERITAKAVRLNKPKYASHQLKLDKLFTGRLTGLPFMVLLLALVLFITIYGANIPSQWLSALFNSIECWLSGVFAAVNAPSWLSSMLITGVYRVLAWVVSVMLPPMAIFFPLFTLLEDLGYLPRVAFNLDNQFKKCKACGKQALTMCMGFGCNAVGVTGCRIIDSERERLIAIITNSFVPCNGRFPMLIAIISMFFISDAGGIIDTALSALLLTLTIAISVVMTFASSALLSKTALKGMPSSFTLELPPFRAPQVGKVLVRSMFDRTVFVLGRAAAVAAPAGLIIWLLANVSAGGATLLAHMSCALDPVASIFGLDGVILMAFIIGIPANEIIIPLIVMAYMANGGIMELGSLATLKAVLVNNGWSVTTAICTMLLTLMHWPCATTLMTISKETKSLKWTALSFVLPTLFGLCACFIVTALSKLFV